MNCDLLVLLQSTFAEMTNYPVVRHLYSCVERRVQATSSQRVFGRP